MSSDFKGDFQKFVSVYHVINGYFMLSVSFFTRLFSTKRIALKWAPIGLLVLGLCATAQAVEIAKGQIDDRIYEYLELDNQLKVILISDPQADKAAASLDVHVGSSDNPKDREGLAHFLEHMLFLGTQKYPNAADYQAFIDDNGGSHNAYTSAEHTNYFFDIDADKLEPALDRFSQFFVAPLFDEVYVDRERQAVHSEYQAKIKDDGRRGYDVFLQQMNPQHPYTKFSVGSLETLADRPNDNVRDDLLAFYEQHYSSHQMNLVVLGRESIEELKAMVSARFSAVPLRTVPPETEYVPLFLPDTLPLEVIHQPVKNIREMSMVFPLPSVQEYYQEKPLSFLGFLIGHEGEGSILSILKSKGWAESLSAGGGNSGAGNASFSITITLTEEGAKHRETIRALVFHALDVVRESGLELWRYQEEQKLAQIAFRFREKGRAISTVRQLADKLHDVPPEEVLSASYLYQRFDKALIQRLLDNMTPDNLYVATALPDAKTDQVTQHYQVPYTVKPLTTTIAALPQELKAAFHLPLRNTFIPENSQLFAADTALQQPLKKSLPNQSTLWAQQDTSFNVPKVDISIRVHSPLISQSLKEQALNRLLISMIHDNLNEMSYPAHLAGLSYALKANTRGLDIDLRGYDDKMDDLLSRVIAEVAQPTINAERFDSLKTELLRHLNNAQEKTPFRQMMREFPHVLYEPYFADRYIAKALEQITLKELIQFSRQWLIGARLQSLVYGNVDQTHLDMWAQTISLMLMPPNTQLASVQPAKVVKLPLFGQADKPLNHHAISVDHNDKAVGLYVQGAGDQLTDHAYMVLIRQLLDSNFYTQLRTEQQLGYIVFLTNMSLKKVPGTAFIVQSPSTPVADIKASISTFIAESYNTIPNDLSGYQRSVATKLLEKPQTLAAQANLVWENILKEEYDFNYRQQLVDKVNAITPEQLKAYYQKTLLKPDALLWFSAEREAKDTKLTANPKQPYYIYP